MWKLAAPVEGSSMHAPRRRNRLDRGASLVEYSLIFSLIAVLTLGAIDYLGGELQTGITHMEAGVSTGPPKVSGGTPSGGGGASGASTSTTAASIVTTTTTTAPPTTTTTAPPTTTTTAPPTTTTTAPRPGYNGKSTPTFADTSARWDGNRWWSSAQVELRDQSGTPLPSGARVQIRMTPYDGNTKMSSTTRWVDVVNGKIVLEDRHDGKGDDDIDRITYEVIDVEIDAPGHAGWNGAKPIVTINQPPK